MKKVKCLWFLLSAFLIFFMTDIEVQAQVRNIYTSPYVTFAPDHQAWTVNQPLSEGTGHGRYNFWYNENDSFSTGIASSLRSLREGEHYYSYAREGMVPVGKWKMTHENARCIHGLGSYHDYHGIDFSTKNCNQPYYSGWVPYCADCGKYIMYALMYISKEAAQSIDAIDTRLEYYYLCPNETSNGEICRHLEQGYGEAHNCNAISYNRYLVVYEKNAGELEVRGEMASSIHIYNNATEYEGQPVTPIKTLTLNSYSRTGYKFKGWNTKPDGTGITFTDGQEIYNLCSDNYSSKNLEPNQGKVRLYAQWERVESNLVFDANGGTYNGENPVRKRYGSKYDMNENGTVTPPQGHTVSFETNGGSYVPSITGTQTFLRWDFLAPLHGRLNGSVYRFLGNMNDTDTAKAVYSPDPIILPSVDRTGSSFGGWYLDQELTILIGFGGDPYTPPEDVTLYAKWVELKLKSTDNYTANSGKGAVDLKWWQPDNINKSYKLYQSSDGGASYRQIFGVTESIDNGEDINQTFHFIKEGDSAKEQTITIPSSGFYTLSAKGAQGGACGDYKGGLGGSASGKFYLTKGEVITFLIGGQDGTNGGGSATTYGNGGGMTEVTSSLKGTLLAAGGGGGATPSGDGQVGGSGTNLVEEGKNGGNGMSGGGGGWQGGAAGEYIVHYHNEECQKETVLSAPAGMYASAANLEDWNCWGIKVDYGADWADAGAHSGGDDEESDAGWYTFRIGGQGNPCIATSENGKMSISFSHDNWGDGVGSGLRSLEISIMNSSGDKIASYDIVDFMGAGPVATTVEEVLICDEYDEPVFTDKVTNQYESDGFWCTYVHQDGGVHVHEDNEYHGNTDITNLWGVLEVEIPEEVDEVYVVCRTEFGSLGGGSRDMSTRLSNIQYTYSENNCGYQNGQVISSKPAYGGSSYVNEQYAVTHSSTSGIHDEDGSASIKAEVIGMAEGQELNNVPSPDTMAPYAVDQESITKEAVYGQVIVSFDSVSDRGTEYYFKAESYTTLTEELMCTSNVTRNMLITGVAGYLYLIDTESTTDVTWDNAENSTLLTERAITVTPENYVQYLHIAAVDRAGNVSDTVHVEISKDDKGVAWNLSTDHILVSSNVGDKDYENVYQNQDSMAYYVRADGATPFLLSYMSYLHGQAREDYQADWQVFDSRTDQSMEQKILTRLPYTVPLSSTETLDLSGCARRMEGSVILTDAMYIGAARENHAQTLSFYQAFTIDDSFDGETVTVTPVAGASFGESVKYSDWEDDITHAVQLIADGTPPEITGLEAFQNVELIDRNEKAVVLEIEAWDALSGVRDFYLKIENEDNFDSMVYTPDDDGIIRVEITKEIPLFSGDFTVTAYAIDNVGNTGQETWHVTEFALDADIERVLAPHDPVFKRGESGDLHVTVWGYADWIEIKFPEFLSEYDTIIEYLDDPEYRKDETIRFMVPLDAPDEEEAVYEVTVTAYKGDRELDKHPSITTIEFGGSVLDEIRTRLR